MKTIFEKGAPGRRGASLPELKADGARFVPESLRRKQKARLPEVSENEVVRHYTALSSRNFHVDKGFYPLGSCTMKYNPKINDEVAGLSGFAQLHPEQPQSTVQGAMELYYELETMLAEVSGMAAVTLQPAAGAHGELTGLLVMRAYHQQKHSAKTKILIPDSAHGTNPASAALAGFSVVQVSSGPDGRVDLTDLRAKMAPDVAGIMLTNPNTLGLYEREFPSIAEIVHRADGLVYMDGANFNAIIGNVRPADIGVDVMHFNLHKTFSTPHGGGGPGSGPVAVASKLEPFLPVPRVRKNPDGTFTWNWDRPLSIGRVHGYYGNFLVVVRAYTYLLSMGAKGIREISDQSVLNANYLLHLIKEKWDLAYSGPVAHEFVLSAKRMRQNDVKALDIAKRLIDMGYHPPTIYFPLIVPEALMIEPTETESRETLDAFAAAMNQIAREASESPELLRHAPVTAFVRRVDELKAAKELKVKAL